MNLNNNFASQNINSINHQNLFDLPESILVKCAFPYLDVNCLGLISHICQRLLLLSDLAKIDYLNREKNILSLLKLKDLPTFARRLKDATQVKSFNLSESSEAQYRADLRQEVLDMVGLFPKLTTLKISNIVEGKPVYLASCLTEKVTELRVLDLSSNHIYKDGIAVLASKVHLLSKLRILKLFNNGISDSAAKELAQLACLPTLETLHLGQNHLTQNGILTFLNNCTQPLKLHTLSLQNNSLSICKSEFLTKENVYKLSSLCSLDLSKSMADFSPQIFALLIGLPNLKIFNFNENTLFNLANSLDYLNNEPLKEEELGLGGIEIDWQGFEALLSRKELFINVRNLDLSKLTALKITLEDYGGLLAELVNGLPNLKVLNISNRLQTEAGLREFLDTLKKLSLDKLILQGAALLVLLDYVEKLNQIKEIQLGGTEFEKFNEVLEAFEKEEQALQKRGDLTLKSEEWRQFSGKKALLKTIRKGFENSCSVEDLSRVKNFSK